MTLNVLHRSALAVRRSLGAVSLAVVVAWAGVASAGPITSFAAWTSASGTTATGLLNGTAVTATFSRTPIFTNNSDMSDTAVFNPPGSNSQQTIVYEVRSAISWTFSSPVSDLLLYTSYWRGKFSQGPTNNTYVFNASPTILSGLTGSSISGNSLTVGDDFSANSGILRFAGPLTSLTLTAPVGAGNSNQEFTLAVSPSAVPEIDPAGMGSVLALVTGSLALIERRRLKVA
jgi:hypothetical protein